MEPGSRGCSRCRSSTWLIYSREDFFFFLLLIVLASSHGSLRRWICNRQARCDVQISPDRRSPLGKRTCPTLSPSLDLIRRKRTWCEISNTLFKGSVLCIPRTEDLGGGGLKKQYSTLIASYFSPDFCHSWRFLDLCFLKAFLPETYITQEGILTNVYSHAPPRGNNFCAPCLSVKMSVTSPHCRVDMIMLSVWDSLIA